ncbi:MAG TPA: heme b synthase [Syntrophales bacterium]|nr:heme b synthase [Syntrophales bacterium]
MNKKVLPHTLRMVAWEVTRSCNLACVHCRASAKHGPYGGELATDEAFRLVDEIAAVSKPIVILTGGEPLLREDIFEIAAYGDNKGLRMVMATNGTLVTKESAGKMLASGIKRVSISIDGMDAKSHDAFRNVTGAFAGALKGIDILKETGVEFQINTTITKANLAQLPDIMALAVSLAAAAHHIFLLVPTGRGKEMAGQAISPAEYERSLNWFHEASLSCPIQLKATCAPHYYRILKQRSGTRGQVSTAKEQGLRDPLHAMTRGCLGGSAFCFVSHTGQVQACGYLEVNCGNVRENRFREIWENSAVFANLRDLKKYKGKCGRCEFINVCGGCRARAYEITGDYLAEEPFCIYKPKR